MTTEEKIDEILTTLKRIEERQIKTTAMVAQVEEAAGPAVVVGSFATGMGTGPEGKG